MSAKTNKSEKLINLGLNTIVHVLYTDIFTSAISLVIRDAKWVRSGRRTFGRLRSPHIEVIYTSCITYTYYIRFWGCWILESSANSSSW